MTKRIYFSQIQLDSIPMNFPQIILRQEIVKYRNQQTLLKMQEMSDQPC